MKKAEARSIHNVPQPTSARTRSEDTEAISDQRRKALVERAPDDSVGPALIQNGSDPGTVDTVS